MIRTAEHQAHGGLKALPCGDLFTLLRIMTHDEKLQSNPAETIDYEQLDNLNRQLADKLAQLRDAGVDVDSERAALTPDSRRDLLRSAMAGFRAEFSSVVNTELRNP